MGKPCQCNVYDLLLAQIDDSNFDLISQLSIQDRARQAICRAKKVC